MWIFFSWKITSFDLLSIRKKVSFRAIWETWAMPPNISCFLNGKVRFVVCLYIFYKNFWVKSKGTILFTNLFYLGWKENSLKIDWDPVGRGAFRENCYDFNETAAIPKLLSLLNRSLESRRLSAERKYFFLYYRWNVQDKNKLFVVALP